jgi:hypothetical protein
VARACSFYDHYSKVEGDFLKMREIVLEKKKPRRFDLYSNFYAYSGTSVEPVHYAECHEGVIHSFQDRYPFSADLHAQVMSQWNPHKALLRVP